MVVMQGYGSNVLDTLSSTRTPMSVLERKTSNSEGDENSITTTWRAGCITSMEEKGENKRRKLDGLCSNGRSLQLSQFHHYWLESDRRSWTTSSDNCLLWLNFWALIWSIRRRIESGSSLYHSPVSSFSLFSHPVKKSKINENKKKFWFVGFVHEQNRDFILFYFFNFWSHKRLECSIQRLSSCFSPSLL